MLYKNHKIRVDLIVLGLLLAFYIINVTYYIKAQSITSDEGSFLEYAVHLVKGHPERVNPSSDNSKMPIIIINLLPRAIEQCLNPGLKKTDFGASDIISGRYMTMLVSLFTILIVYRWSKELYGRWAGVFSAFLISFCPNMISNSGLVTTDSYSMLFLTTTMYCLWKFCNNPSNKYFILFSICIGFSQLVKQSLIFLYILSPLTLFTFLFAIRPIIQRKMVIWYSVIFIFINWVIINLGFYFRDTNTPLANYHFASNLFIHVQHFLPGWIPVPFPKAFISGLDLSNYYDQTGGGNSILSSFGKITILGKSSTGGSFWYYYLVSIFFKTPISSILLVIAGLLTLVKTQSFNGFFKNEFFLLFPVAYYLLYMSFFYNTQIGIRQIIFIYPFFYIICGILIIYSKGIYKTSLIAVLGIFLVFSILNYWRNYYPYTNEFIADKKMAYSYVGAANLEINQGNLFFAKYLKEHPEVKPISAVPETGVFLINTNDYLDIWNTHQYEWISHIKPSSDVARNGLIITVTKEDIEQLPEHIKLNNRSR